MKIPPDPEIRISSGEPWRLSLTVVPMGRDYLCRVTGGDAHAGAVALSEWCDDEPLTGVLTARGHRETAIAKHAAHRLCEATGRTVACVAGIHFDDIGRAEIEDISLRARDLVERAALKFERGDFEHAAAQEDS